MKVSVAMITYQHEKFVREALDGILMQETNFDYEIVIGEDASKDGTADIIKEYMNSHPNIFNVTFYDSNIGMMPNFCNTLNACSGEYIALCEGDDYWTDKDKLQKQVDFLDLQADFSGCFHNVIVKDERNVKNQPKPWRTYDKTDFNIIDTFSRISLLHTCSFMFRASALETPDWFHEVKSGDMSLFTVVASKGNFKLLEGNMGVYRKNDGGVTYNEQLKNYHSNRLKLWNFVNRHYNNKYFEDIEKVITFHKSELRKLDTSLKGKLKRKFNI